MHTDLYAPGNHACVCTDRAIQWWSIPGRLAAIHLFRRRHDLPGRAVTLKFDHESPINLEIIEGELNIDRVQRLYVDEDLSRTIMSGYFQFKTFLDNEPVAISQGRFDLGIG